jgi:glycosyltransferase involved in cell wall biosynthesis
MGHGNAPMALADPIEKLGEWRSANAGSLYYRRMSKIAIDARELRTSTGRYIERLLHYLQQIDNEHDYYVLLKPKDMAGWEPSNPRFHKVASPYKEFTFGEQIGFKRSVTTIHDLTTVRFRNPAKNPVVYWVKQQIFKVVVCYAARKSKQVITPTQFVAQDVANFAHINPSKITVTLESADKITDIPESVASVAGKKYLLYVGRPLPHKNLWRLIQAFKQLQTTHPNLYLVLAGKYENNYVQTDNRAKSEQIANLIFTDFVSEAQLRWLYENTAAYVFPSLSEGFGLPGLETMHYGAPVLSSNATCLPEVYGEAAHYFDPLNVDDMAAKIGQVLDDTQLASNLAAKGLIRVNNFSWQRMAQQTLAVYKKTLGE